MLPPACVKMRLSVFLPMTSPFYSLIRSGSSCISCSPVLLVWTRLTISCLSCNIAARILYKSFLPPFLLTISVCLDRAPSPSPLAYICEITFTSTLKLDAACSSETVQLGVTTEKTSSVGAIFNCSLKFTFACNFTI